MTLDEYCDFVTKLASKDSMVDFKSKLTTGAMGMAGEAGEVVDIAKKILFHGQPYTDEVRQKLIKELGDEIWYLAFFCRNVLNISIEEVIEANVQKLSARYKSLEFTTEEFMAKEKAKND